MKDGTNLSVNIAKKLLKGVGSTPTNSQLVTAIPDLFLQSRDSGLRRLSGIRGLQSLPSTAHDKWNQRCVNAECQPITAPQGDDR